MWCHTAWMCVVDLEFAGSVLGNFAGWVVRSVGDFDMILGLYWLNSLKLRLNFSFLQFEEKWLV